MTIGVPGAGPQPPRVLDELQRLLPTLTKSVRKVAELALAEPVRVGAMTVSELATSTGTSEATVVRAARALGFPGYRELRVAMQRSGSQCSKQPAVRGDIGIFDPMPQLLHKLVAEESRRLQETADRLDSDALDRATDALLSARRIDLYGIGASGMVAQDLHSKLGRIGRYCTVNCEMHAAVTSATVLTEDDVAVGFSYSGDTIDTVLPLRSARAAGASTIAVTSQPNSALAQTADLRLLIGRSDDPHWPGAMAGRTSQLFVVDALFVALTQRSFGSSHDALERTAQAVAERRMRGAYRHPL